MFRSLSRWLTLLLLWFLPYRAGATEWETTSFRQALAESEWVVLAEIVEANSMFARTRTLETLKGEPLRGEFVVTGFNNACWPTKDRDRHSVRAKERYLFLLKAQRSQPSPLGSKKVPSECPSEPSIPKAWRGLPLYSVPNPALGSYLVERDRVYADWNFCSDCSETLAAPANVVLPILSGLARPSELSAVAAGREALLRELTPELVRSAQHDAGAQVTLSWLLEGQAKFGSRSTKEAVLAATQAKLPELRSAALRALPSLGPQPEVFRLIENVLTTPDIGGELHARATIALTHLDPEGRTSTDRVLAAIAGADASESVLREVPTTGLGPNMSARETMVRALTQFRARHSEAALLSLLRRADNQPGTLDALLQHFRTFPSAQARTELIRQCNSAPASALQRMSQFFVDTGDDAAVEVALHTSLGRSKSMADTYAMLRYYALHRASGNSQVERIVRRALNERRADGELALLLPLALVLDDQQLIRNLLALDASQLVDSDPKTAERVARAILLKRAPPSDAKAKLQAWLQLLIDDRWSGHATPYLLRECVCATGDPLLPELKQQLDVERLSALAERVTEFSESRRGHLRICSPATTAKPSSASAPAIPVSSIAPAKRGCGAGCVLSPSNPHSELLLGALLAFALLRRRYRSSMG